MKDKSMIIPTSYRSKISSKHSYPIGAEAISEKLGDLPQSSDFTLYFSSFGSQHISIHSDICVMDIEYSFHRPTSESMIRLGFGTPNWKITVHPVPRQLRHQIKQMLEASGIPLLREWSIIHRDITGNEGCERISVVFDPSIERIRFDCFSNMGPKVSKRKKAQLTGPANHRPFGTSGMAPADSASRAGAMPEASGDS